jgi:Domain of unknown function (DUF4157)
VRVATHDALGFGGGVTAGHVVHLGPTATRGTLAHELAHVVQQRELGARFLQGRDGSVAATSGADVVLRLRPSVRPRTTFTFGDSLDETLSGLSPDVGAEPLTQPSALAAQGTTDPLRLASLAEVSAGSSPVYTEAQVHGGITLADIGEVVFTNGVRPSPQLRAALDAAGLRWRVAASARP